MGFTASSGRDLTETPESHSPRGLCCWRRAGCTARAGGCPAVDPDHPEREQLEEMIEHFGLWNFDDRIDLGEINAALENLTGP